MIIKNCLKKAGQTLNVFPLIIMQDGVVHKNQSISVGGYMITRNSTANKRHGEDIWIKVLRWEIPVVYITIISAILLIFVQSEIMAFGSLDAAAKNKLLLLFVPITVLLGLTAGLSGLYLSRKRCRRKSDLDYLPLMISTVVLPRRIQLGFKVGF